MDIAVVTLLVVMLVVGRWTSRRAGAPALLPDDDQPPPAAWEPMPSRLRLRGYVAAGLAEIDRLLAARSPNQQRGKRVPGQEAGPAEGIG